MIGFTCTVCRTHYPAGFLEEGCGRTLPADSEACGICEPCLELAGETLPRDAEARGEIADWIAEHAGTILPRYDEGAFQYLMGRLKK